jgi:hypothetical protein
MCLICSPVAWALVSWSMACLFFWASCGRWCVTAFRRCASTCWPSMSARMDRGWKPASWRRSEPILVRTATIAPATIAPATIAPATIAPATIAPATIAPATIAPATIAPATTQRNRLFVSPLPHSIVVGVVVGGGGVPVAVVFVVLLLVFHARHVVRVSLRLLVR